jgi:hypothetical protein
MMMMMMMKLLLWTFLIARTESELHSDATNENGVSATEALNSIPTDSSTFELESVTSILDRHGSDKGEWCHYMGLHYEDLFRPYRKKATKYLEIGVFEGSSLRSMAEIFQTPGSMFVGLDIDSSCLQYASPDKNMFVKIGDASNLTFLQNIYDSYGKFDIILDDGSHQNRDMIMSFELLFPILNENGLYIVEDTAIYLHPSYNSEKYPNIIAYFQQFIPHLSPYVHSKLDGSYAGQCCSNPNIPGNHQHPIMKGIHKIEFGSNYIAIHKKTYEKWRH